MTKVTLNETTPTAQVVAKAAADVIITDGRGRAIKLRRPGVLAQFRLIETLGDTARNGVYVNMVLPLIYVSAIDDDSIIQFSKKSEIEALIQRLDEDGVAAVMEGVSEHFGKPDPATDKAKLGN
jgi:hypothetical protein